MLQYEDLTLRDVNYYWRKAILLFERDGAKIPCLIYQIDEDNRYPITLIDMRTSEKLVNLRLSTFVRQVLIHHPALGYGDYKGVPLYLSTRAGQNLTKGVDNNNITVLCPVDWGTAIKDRLTTLSKKANDIINSGKSTLPRDLSKEYLALQKAAAIWDSRNSQPNLSGTTIASGRVVIHNNEVWAHVINQSVNNIYPTLGQALNTIRRDTVGVTGVSISRDFAIVHTTKAPAGTAALFHKMAQVGYINLISGDVAYNKNIKDETVQSLKLIFNRASR